MPNPLLLSIVKNMTKYQKYFNQMLKKNKKLFKDFESIHNRYVLEPQKYQEEFNEVGKPIVEVIKEYENRLCGHSEKGIYGKFSSTLAEKFWNLVRQTYSKVDFVGVKIKRPAKKENQEISFEIKKIKLL